MIKKEATPLIATAICLVTTLMAGCGQHVEKKHEELVSPSEQGTPAEREPQGPVHHGEAPSNAEP
jgi:hypothetical protein